MPTAAAQPIELRIREIGQLFHTLDPLPFRERDLDEAVEDYVVGWARELPTSAPIQIVIHLPSAEAAREDAKAIAAAIGNYFNVRAEMMSLELKDLFRIGRISLLIGLAMLGACIGLGMLADHVANGGYLDRVFDEGLIILGWVANWRPIQIFLYDWWPLQRRRHLLLRLADASVRVVSD